MRAALLLLLFVTLVTVKTVSGRKIKKDKTKPAQSGVECINWHYSNCVPSNGDCGAGFREASCDQQTKKMKCRVPCKWKNEFGADCKYRFGSWGECNPSTGLRTRTGTLRVALHDSDCHQTVFHSKPCPGKTKTKTETTKTKTKGKKRKGKAN